MGDARAVAVGLDVHKSSVRLSPSTRSTAASTRSSASWTVSRTRVEDVSPDEALRRLSEPAYADAMREAQETLERELSRRSSTRSASG
jgi:PhnB protein